MASGSSASSFSRNYNGKEYFKRPRKRTKYGIWACILDEIGGFEDALLVTRKGLSHVPSVHTGYIESSSGAVLGVKCGLFEPTLFEEDVITTQRRA